MEKPPHSKEPGKEKMERIEKSAVRHEGSIYTGKRHSDAINAAAEATGKTPVTGEQGFVTSTGRFVSREEAAKIAFSAGQITAASKGEPRPETGREEKEKLFSEDLW